MKRFLAAILVLAACAYGCFAEGTSSAGFQFGIGSGYIFYGDSGTKNLVADMNSAGFSRFIFGGDAGIYVPFAENVQFIAETELLSDLFWKGGQHCYFFDYAFLGGLKVFPGLGGLSFSVAYALGRRSGIIDIDNREATSSSTDWGNGFKFCTEYDMKYGTGGIAPVIGAYWRHMPRGGSSDNTISVYFRFVFR
jgi:hypothetical protein